MAGIVEAIARWPHQDDAGVACLTWYSQPMLRSAGNKVVLSRFRHVERQAEEVYFDAAFTAHGFEVLTLPPELPFEGAGDALMDRSENLLWFGHGHRSDIACATRLSQLL